MEVKLLSAPDLALALTQPNQLRGSCELAIPLIAKKLKSIIIRLSPCPGRHLSEIPINGESEEGFLPAVGYFEPCRIISILRRPIPRVIFSEIFWKSSDYLACLAPSNDFPIEVARRPLNSVRHFARIPPQLFGRTQVANLLFWGLNKVSTMLR